MNLGRPYRALALPALAILVPSALIAILAYQWLAATREADQLRSDKAAAAALQSFRQQARSMLAETARGLLPLLVEKPRAIRESGPDWPAMVAEAYLLDGTSHLAGSRSSQDA